MVLKQSVFNTPKIQVDQVCLSEIGRSMQTDMVQFYRSTLLDTTKGRLKLC